MTAAPDGAETSYFWAAAEGPGLEHLRLRLSAPENIAHGLVLGVRDGEPYRLLYKVKWGPDWRVRKATFEVHDARGARARMLKTDGRGKWRDDNDELPELAGCTDLDIAATPFTNTLALRRLDLKPGQATEIRTAYVSLPGLAVRPVPQRYACLARTPQGQSVAYEGLSTGFKAELPLDADGIVIDYPGNWRRLAPR